MILLKRFLIHPLVRVVIYLFVADKLTDFLVWLLFKQLFHPHHLLRSVAYDLVYSCDVIAYVSLFWLMKRFIDKDGGERRLLSWRGGGKELGVGFGIGVLLYLMLTGLFLGSGAYRVTAFHFTPPIWQSASAALIIAVKEEVAFRGYVLTTLEGRWKTVWAVVVSSILFGAAHYQNLSIGSSRLLYLDVIGGASLIGLIDASGYIMTRRLWLPIGLHWAWDFMAGILYRNTELHTKGLFEVQIAGNRAVWVHLLFGLMVGGICLRFALRQQQKQISNRRF